MWAARDEKKPRMRHPATQDVDRRDGQPMALLGLGRVSYESHVAPLRRQPKPSAGFVPIHGTKAIEVDAAGDDSRLDAAKFPSEPGRDDDDVIGENGGASGAESLEVRTQCLATTLSRSTQIAPVESDHERGLLLRRSRQAGQAVMGVNHVVSALARDAANHPGKPQICPRAATTV
jgi:hypothetical protein